MVRCSVDPDPDCRLYQVIHRMERLGVIMETVTLASILTDITSVVTSALQWAGSVVTFIVQNPLIMVFVIMSLVAFGIHMVRLMISI